MTWKKVDSNQGEIVQALRAIGAEWIATSGDPNIGFDGIVLFRGKALIVEIKDGAKSPSARRLTEGEAKRKLQCEAHGVPYLILQSVEQAIKTVGALKNSVEVKGTCDKLASGEIEKIERELMTLARRVKSLKTVEG